MSRPGMDTSLVQLIEAVRVKKDEARDLGYFSSLSGGACYFLAPERSHITLDDIALTLARFPRWGGRTKACLQAYSVAEHSIHVSYLVPEEHALAALMHDATEAYLGDIPSPLKRLLGAVYKDLETSWALEIGKRFGLGTQLAHLPEAVKKADLIALEMERHDLMEQSESWSWWGWLTRPVGETLGLYQSFTVGGRDYPRTEQGVARAFKARFAELRYV